MPFQRNGFSTSIPGYRLHDAFSLLGYSTSDHGFQQINIQDQTGLSVRCVTWNTMDKCHSVSAIRPYTNNPMNIDETLNQYKNRKLAQFQKIFSMMRNTPSDQQIDCLFLQEIDWTRMLYTEPQGGLDKVQKELCNLFLNELERLGWGFVLAPKAPVGSSVSQQPVLTLYNKRCLLPIEGSGKGVLLSQGANNQNQRYRGYQMTFTHNVSGKVIDLVNFHLNYEYDHRQDLIEVMEDSIANDRMVVMGGDANHPPNFAMDTLTGEWNLATAADKDDEIFKKTGQIVMTTEHLGVGQKNIAKHYDGFCAGSSEALKITKEAGEHFELVQNGVKLVKDQPNTLHPYHQSEVGYPWIRGRALMVHLDKKLGTLSSRTEQVALLNTMQQIARERFNELLSTAAAHKKYPLPNAIRALSASANRSLSAETTAPTIRVALEPIDRSLRLLQRKNIVISPTALNSLKEVMKRLQDGHNSWNPYYMNSGEKLNRILRALSTLPSGSNFQQEISNSSSELYKAINMQRISPFTFWGALGFNQSKSLMKIQDTLEAQSNRFDM